jgi:membrane protease YdiL (CAAX protease family)
MRFDAVPLQSTFSVVAGILAGFAVLLGAEVPTSRILAANLALYPLVPWAPFLAALFLYLAWQYLNGRGWPPESSAARQRMLRSRTLPPTIWLWSLISGGLGLVTWGALALLIAHLGRLGPIRASDCSQVPPWTMACVILMRAIEEGVFQEAAFRGYIQTTLEECCGPATAIVLTATLFGAVQFLGNPSVAIWLISFVAGLILSLVAYLTGSIRPGIVLHVSAKLVLVTSQLQGITPLAGESERSIFAICVTGIVLAVTTIAALRRLDTTVLDRAGEFHG